MIQLPRVLLRVVCAMVALTFTACAGSGASGPAPGHVCPAIVGLRSATLVQPANGAAGVSIAIGSVVATSDTGLAGAQVVLAPASGVAFDGGIFTVASTTTVSAAVPALAAHTTYTVTGSSIGECPGTTEWTIGSFTTQ